jgi:hypothetical protein
MDTPPPNAIGKLFHCLNYVSTGNSENNELHNRKVMGSIYNSENVNFTPV